MKKKEEYIIERKSTKAGHQNEVSSYVVLIPRGKDKKKYYANYKVKDYPSRKACYLAAIDDRNRALYSLANGKEPQSNGALTVQETFESIEENYSKRKNTYKRYQSNYRTYIAPYFAGKALDKVTVRDVEFSLNAVAGKCTQESVIHVKALWSKIFKCAYKLGKKDIYDLTAIADVPISEIETQRSMKEVSLTEEQFNEFMEFASSYGAYSPTLQPNLIFNRDMMLYALHVQKLSGIRSQEVRALTWDDVHFIPETETSSRFVIIDIKHSLGSTHDIDLTLRKLKTTQSKRTIPLNAFAYDLFSKIKEYEKNRPVQSEMGLIFANYEGKGINSTDYSNFFRRIMKKLKEVKHVTYDVYPTLFRKLKVSNMMASGTPLDVVQRYVGHEIGSATTIQNYDSPSFQQLIDAVQREKSTNLSTKK